MLSADVAFEHIVRDVRSGRMDLGEARRLCCKARRAPQDSAALGRAKCRLKSMPVIIIYEHLEESLRIMGQRLEISIPCQIPRINSFKNRVAMGDLSQSEIELARSLTFTDISIYNYALNITGFGVFPNKGT
jgi:hypothetical protein